MPYDALEQEKQWRRKPAGKKPRGLPERHHFPHNRVRAKLSEALIELGCNAASSVLEIGCGSGEDVEFIRRASGNITGVDISPEAVEAFGKKGFQGFLADAGKLPFAENTFDYVIYPATLHHLAGQGNLTDYLKEAARVVRKKGYVIALEPNLLHISGLLMNVFNTIKPGITGLVPHERALSPFHLMGAFRAAGLESERCRAASYTWNRLPLGVSRFIAGHEDGVRGKTPFNLFGWFSIVWGKKGSV
ncbi:MAG: class I SAM-dependent methyltransferase [Chloroflexota bacterium]